MARKIIIGGVVALVLFLGYVSTREGKFRYERSGVIKASPEEVFPYISNLKLGGEWSPYEKKDPQMKKTFTGDDGAAGSKMEFAGNRDTGAGNVEVLKVVPNKSVEIKLTMTEPMFAENVVEYSLIPETEGTRFTWAISGDGGFLGKLVSVFIDCEKMFATDMNAGIENLKSLIETKKTH